MADRNATTKPLILLPQPAIDLLLQGLKDTSRVSGLTHEFYKYPARYSPLFVRAVIDAFTEPGELVFDPFMGGGTTIVEALAAGRNGIGTDISSLAAFVSEVKTTVYSEAELAVLVEWKDTVAGVIDINAEVDSHAYYEGAGYLKHLDRASTWRIRKAISQAISSTKQLGTPRLESFARCTILRTAQWALDGRRTIPSFDTFRTKLKAFAEEMIAGAMDLLRATAQAPGAKATCLNISVQNLPVDQFADFGKPPKLILTSPPYPGVHVLYHRWQIEGGKETPTPFWIANKLDGDGASYYTMGDRKSPRLTDYFSQLRTALTSLAKVCDKNTTLVQVVAFSEPDWQLPRYLSVADDAGFQEHFLARNVSSVRGKRLRRRVPNRKWYATQKGETSGSQEIVLFHRLK